jgi:hypothetical protein
MTAQMTWLSILVALLLMDVIIIAVRVTTLVDRKKSGTIKHGWYDLKLLSVAAAIIAVHVAAIAGLCFYHQL